MGEGKRLNHAAAGNGFRRARAPWPPSLRRYGKVMRAFLERGWRGICFDLDGVLIHTMPFHAKAWQETVRSAGLSLTRSEVYQWEGEPGTKTADRLLRRGGREVTAQAVRALLDAKEARFAALSRAVVVEDGWLDVLRRLHRGGMPLALVTGTSMGEARKLLPAPFLKQFDVIITGDQVSHGKPHPEPYAKACEALSAAPETILVVENAPYGIRSAKASGAGCVVGLTTSLPARYLGEADLIIRAPERLQQLLLFCGGFAQEG